VKLYHGTSDRHLPAILRDGIRPRGKREGNWKHTSDSHPDCAYLTNAYAHYFAISALETKREQCAVVEIDTDKLDAFFLLPDEDALAQVHKKAYGGDLLKLTAFYRDSLFDYCGGNAWRDSVKFLGTCAYFGVIPTAAITRIATFSREGVVRYADPTITLQNYQIMGAYYRNLVRAAFNDDEIEPDMMQPIRTPAPVAGVLHLVNRRVRQIA
jgi:hypothetical protein